MAELVTDVERYANPTAFAREVNLPLLGSAALPPVSPGASLSALLAASTLGSLGPIVEGLAQTRQSLTLRSLLLAGFPHDPECFAFGLALGRAWSRLGLKIAIVDLDGWNPTVLRPIGEPAEGFVDVLEYGCSFQRVAWEIVAGSLWLVGPGSHPPDEVRLTEHPDWDRVTRVFASHADVTLFVAPLLHKSGLTGRLSKRVDAALMTTSVERVGRTELRDAFLELWGSDAPIIGCVALEPLVPASPPPPPAVPGEAADHDPFEPIAVPGRAGAPEFPSTAEPPPETHGAAEPVLEAPAPARAVIEDEPSLVSALEAEVRAGTVTRRAPRRSSNRFLWAGVVAGLGVGAVVAAWMTFVDTGVRPLPNTESLVSGEERILPAPSAPDPSGAASPAAQLPGANAGPGAVTPPVAAGLTGAPRAAAPPNAGPPASGKPYRVHVASFRSEDKVAPIVRDLRLKGVDAWFEAAPDAPGWYRVFVGRFATPEEASAYAAWLLENKWVDRAQAFPSTAR
jgi:cell division septation protein DedD